MEDQHIENAALVFAKREGKRIAKELTDTSVYHPDEEPVSVFMAGSPGAGKTEYSKNLIAALHYDKGHQIIRIDADDLRPLFQDFGYNGANSYLFQGAVSLIVEKIHDLVLSQGQSFVFDGTFSNDRKALDNIKRSLDKERSVAIFYLYQDPQSAWKFTQDREKAEGRNIPKSSFIKQFFGSKLTVTKALEAYGNDIAVYMVTKNYENNTVEDVIHVKPLHPEIDKYIVRPYTEEELETLL